ncbi:MAG: hypothetical protein IPN19_04015 [Elusimicrobia bacterium]|nr:hypothetical protein [Elusimicrobiota bacterium]
MTLADEARDDRLHAGRVMDPVGQELDCGDQTEQVHGGLGQVSWFVSLTVELGKKSPAFF